MNKAKNKIVLVIVLALLVLLVLAAQKTKMAEDAKEEATEVAENSYGKTYTLDETTGISKAVQILVQKSDASVTGNLPLDEAFYYWVAEKYGNGALCNVAYQVEAGLETASSWETQTGTSLKALYAGYCADKGFSTYISDNVTWTNTLEDREESNVITVIGDVCLADNWRTMDAVHDSETITSAVSGDLISLFHKSAVTWANNEFVYCDGGTPLEGKDYTFEAATENVSYMTAMGVNFVSLANNHVYDYGEEGLLSTIDTLDEAGIDHVGAGANLAEASNIKYYVVNGKKIAFVAATQVEITLNYTKEATATTAGVMKTLDSTLFCQEIEAAKANADYVIAYVHWGWEGRLYADEEQKDLINDYIAAGADVIVGNHPHRMQGIQYIDGVPVVYSLGNFLMSDADLYTMVLQITVEDDGLTLSIVPCEQKDTKVSMITDTKAVQAFYEYVADLSYSLGITEDGTIAYRTDEPDGSYAYYSGMAYTSHSANVDLQNRTIDGVGNLKQN